MNLIEIIFNKFCILLQKKRMRPYKKIQTSKDISTNRNIKKREKLFGTGIAATKNYGRYISRRIYFRL